MTAHIVVAELDSVAATLSRAVVHKLLREELGYDGLVIADALEMKAISATVGVERGAVLAVAAGIDALLVGHDLGEEDVAAIEAALVDAVESGRLSEERLREAASRVGRAGRWASTPAARRPVGPDAGREAAERALEFDGELGLMGPVLVVELRPRANIAAGEAEHAFGSVLEGRLPGVQTLVLDESSAHPARVLETMGTRQLVVLVRDLHRHAWMEDVAAALLSSAPTAIVVEVGLPQRRPANAQNYAATYGGSRVSYEALADRLLAPSGVAA
jgi:beta-N-acetylhexosaminidase